MKKQKKSLADVKNFAIFTGKHLCWSLFFSKAWRAATLLKEAPTHMLSCKYCETFKNTFSDRTPPVAAFEELLFLKKSSRLLACNFKGLFLRFENLNLTSLEVFFKDFDSKSQLTIFRTSIFKNTSLSRTLPVAVSEQLIYL